MVARISKIENGSAVPSLEAEGTTTAGTDSEQNDIKVCPHRYSGCISQNGYMCLNPGPCDPIDENGRRFAVSYTKEAGQTFMHKALVPLTRLGKGTCAKPLMEIPAVISADDLQAELAKTPFADTEPFDASQFVNDIVGS